MAHSFSTFKDLSCPARYVKKHVQRREEPSSEAANVGKICADLMAAMRSHWFDTQGQYLTPEGRLGEKDASVERHGATEEEGERALEIVNAAVDALELLPDPATVEKYWIERGIAFDKDMFPAELEGDYYTDAWAGAWFKCKPDFAWMDRENVLHIEDDKSGWNIADGEQLVRYAQAEALNLLAQTKEMPAAIELRFNYLAKRSMVRVPFEPEQRLYDWITAWERATEDAKANPVEIQGPHCDWCGFVAECGRHEKTREQLVTIDPDNMKQITSRDQAVAGGMWLMAAKRCVAAAEAKLREYVDANGPVEIAGTGMVMRITPSEPARSATVADVLCELMGAGIPQATITNTVKISPKDVEDVLKQVYPRGTGVTKANMAKRVQIMEALEDVWAKSPRASRFTIGKADVA